MTSYVAIFDLDQTIINTKSLFEVYKAYCLSDSKIKGEKQFHHTIRTLHQAEKKGIGRSEINKMFYRHFSGFSKRKMEGVIEAWVNEKMEKKDFFNKKELNALRFHQRRDAAVIIVSGSFYGCVAALAKKIRVNNILSVTLECNGDTYTGELVGKQTIGLGKIEAITEYVQKNQLSFAGSCGYGDHISDLDFLKYVENPVVVGKSIELNQFAKLNQWKIME